MSVQVVCRALQILPLCVYFSLVAARSAGKKPAVRWEGLCAGNIELQ